MQKIIKGVFKSLIDNASLIWLLFVGNILFSYIVYRFKLTNSIFFVVLFSLAAIYLFSIVMQGIVLHYAGRDRSWGNILKKGLKNFPAMLGWFLFCLGITISFVLYFSRIYGARAAGLWPIMFFLAGYVSGPLIAGLYEGLNLKTSISSTFRLIKTRTGTWLLGGLFLVAVLVITGAAAELMIVLVAYTRGAGIGILGPLFVFTSEFVKAGSIVATMSTIVALRYAAPSKENI